MAQSFKARKRLIAARDGGYRCAYCGVASTRRALTVDHVIPRSKGGSGMRRNLVLACLPCNAEKGDSLGWVPKFADGWIGEVA